MNNSKKSSFWESKYFKIGIGLLNFALIVGLVTYIFVLRSGIGENNKSSLDKVEANVYTDEMAAAAMDEANESMATVFDMLIKGCSAELENGSVMNFGFDNSFSGFFTVDAPNVTGYSYETTIVETDENPDYICNVNIFNSDKNQYVQYKLLYDESDDELASKDLFLYHPESKLYIKLMFN